MTKFLFASDSFKGSLSSEQVGGILAQAALRAFPEASTRVVPLADGGEGTVRAVATAAGGELRTATVRGPLGAPVEAEYALLPGGRAVIEMAAAAGLPLVPPAARDPRRTSTYGVGQLIGAALDAGARDIALGIGGSATNDGGMGCLQALGVRFLDQAGGELEGVGASLAQVARLDTAGLDPRIARTRLQVMCDVDNPLLGDRGATRVFAPQKGAAPQAVEQLEAGMRRYATVLADTFPGADVQAPGMGAAGGLGLGACVVLGGQLVSGIECVLDLAGFDLLLQGCNLCVTGEGHADAQSAHGKLVSGVAARCRAAGVPCVAVVGGMDADALALQAAGVVVLVPSVIDAGPLEDALAHAERNLALAADRLFALLKMGGQLG